MDNFYKYGKIYYIKIKILTIYFFHITTDYMKKNYIKYK